MGTLAVDLWTLVLGNLLQESVYYYFKFWFRVYCRWGSIVAYPAKCFIKILLKNIYHIWRPKFRLQFYSDSLEERYTIWSVLGLDKIPNCSEQIEYLEDAYDAVNAEINRFLDGTLSVQEYGKLLKHLQLLSSTKKVLKPNEQFQNNLNLLSVKIKNLCDINKFTPLVILLLNLIPTYSENVDPSTTINEIKQFYSLNLLTSLKLEILFCLQRLNTPQYLNDIFKNETNIIIVALINKNSISSRDSTNSLIKVNLVKFEHICNRFNDPEDDRNVYENSPKRIKLSNEGTSDIDICKELKRFEESVNNIALYCEGEPFNNRDLAVFNKILDKANSIVNKL